MSRRKSKRIVSFLTLSNTFDSEKKQPPSWPAVFGNDQSLVLELGAGHGTYTVALAELQPEYNYIGIDRQSPRLLVGARLAQARALTNTAFLRAPIEQIGELFPPQSVAEIWLPFPDPYPKARHEKKRLTAPRFLILYQKLLSLGGVVHLKTDNPALYQFTLESVAAVGGVIEAAYPDIDQVTSIDPRVLIQTPYEETHRRAGKQVAYVRLAMS